MDTADSNLEFLDDNTPLPELSFEDLMEPTAEKGGQHMDNDARGSDDNVVEGEDDSLNTPQFKKTVPEKRNHTPGVTVLKSHAIKVVTAGSGSTVASGSATTSLNPNKPQITDVKILNKLKPIVTSNTLKIGSTTIASTSSTAGGTSKTLSSMTQIKTPDGRVLFVQKSIPGTPSTSAKTLVTGSPTGSIRRIVAPTGIQKAVLSKGVAVAGTGLVKAAVPGRLSNSGITLKGITSVAGGSAKPSPSSTASPSTTGQPAKFQVVRTADGKIIKINQSGPSVVLNAKPQTTVAAAAPSVKPTTTGNVVVSKSGSQVVLKTTPAPKQVLTASPTPTTPSKMVVQSGGKQILVSSKNIIKLSPKSPGTSTASSAGSPSVSGLHAIQLPGKGGVQYVRVLSNKGATAGATAATTSKSTPGGQKITLLRSPAGAASTSTISASPAATSVAGSKAGPSPANKIVVKSAGGSIVPLPSVQTFVSKRALSATPNATKVSTTEVNQDSIRKHRLTDLNTQLKHISTGSDANDTSDTGPDAKKPRYVITMQQGKPQLQTTTPSGSNLVGRSPDKESPSAPKKIYNVIKSAGGNGVKYMIRNPQTMTHAMRRGYTGYMDNKMRTSLAATKQRLNQANPQQKKQLQVQAQAKQRIRQQQLQNQQAKGQDSGSQGLPTQGSQYLKVLGPTKPLYDTLKPPATGTGAAIDALGGLGASRRKHCNCSKSQCLKLYCDCFANGEFCQNCTCKDCFNNLDYEVERERAIRSCLDRNPSAFKPKITAPNSGDMRLHNKGCNCKRSGCLKNYCECYEAKIPCTSICKCVGCRNMEDRPDVDMDSLDGVVGAQQSKAKGAKDKKKIENRSNLYLTNDVIEATIMCMISRIVMHEKHSLPIEDTEREVMEELGESLNQIILYAKGKHDTSQLDDSKATAEA
ncbi:uncharacterized protein Dana_GF13699, isoform B [Drosophila ananassae]|uniref:Uncharacterized protein, isoform B n=1 Tax=Drosophila ananassae TaxID=7217 RepID=A0A0P8Y6T0_DROAN|nr:protein lin-54 homolog isoform X2 [Drosophila ananassae]KPU77102.1 uncharacterized protein Dana_GF13699, isoform B [Drosophila ananassae]